MFSKLAITSYTALAILRTTIHLVGECLYYTVSSSFSFLCNSYTLRLWPDLEFNTSGPPLIFEIGISVYVYDGYFWISFDIVYIYWVSQPRNLERFAELNLKFQQRENLFTAEPFHLSHSSIALTGV